MTGTWGEELARLRREVVELLESAEADGRVARWATRRWALWMWNQLDATENFMHRQRDLAIERWFRDSR